MGKSRVYTADAQEAATVSSLLGAPCQDWVRAASSLGFVAFWACGFERPLVLLSGGGLVAMGLASSNRVQPSASFCTLGNPPSLVLGQSGLLSCPPPPTSLPGLGSLCYWQPTPGLGSPMALT